MASPGPAANPPGRDWVAWHQPYDQPGSRLARRLAVVQAFTRDAIESHPAGPVRVISICAGQCRDLAGALTDHPRRDDVVGRAVELDPSNVAVAERLLSAAGVRGIQVVEGDASLTTAYAGSTPADLVLACGIFGNISDGDIRTFIEHLPHLCAPSAKVIWSRHTQPPDLTPTIREWFAESGFEDVGFVAPADSIFGVGAQRLTASPLAFEPGVRLFDFVGYS